MAYMPGSEDPWMRERVNLIRRQDGWWFNLDVLSDGMEILKFLQELNFEIHILTKGPSSSTNSWTEKIKWCEKHLPPDMPVTITSDKGLVYGKVLVDDFPGYIKDWLKYRPRGLVVMPDRPWNQGFEHPNVIRFTGTNECKIQTRIMLQKVAERLSGEPLEMVAQ